MIYLFSTIHVFNCLFLILVVLLQQGKGADLSVFGGGGTMTAFGARGAATLLHKMTVFGFVGFIVTTLIIGVLQKQGGGSSVMDEVPGIEEPVAGQDGDEAAEPEEAVGVLPEDDGTASDEGTADGDVKPEAEEFESPTDPAEGETSEGDGDPAGEGSTN